MKRNILSRFLVAGVGIPTLWVLLYVAPNWAWWGICGLAVCITAWEFAEIVWPEQGAGLVMMTSSVFVYGVFLMLHLHVLHGNELILRWLANLMVAAVVFALLVSLALSKSVMRQQLRSFGFALGSVYLGGLIACFALLRSYGSLQQGASITLLALSSAFASDAAAMGAGKLFGGHGRRLARNISPNKTVRGAIGGLLGSCLVTGILHRFVPGLANFSLAGLLLLAVIASAFGQLGDLCESWIKRAFDVKDSGTILPGHGGLFDRIDALLFSGAVYFVTCVSGLMNVLR